MGSKIDPKIMFFQDGQNEFARMLSKPVSSKRVVAMKTVSGARCTRRADIAETLAGFYEHLYELTSFSNDVSNLTRLTMHDRSNAVAVTEQDVRDAINKLKAGRTCGDDELLAEMLKN